MELPIKVAFTFKDGTVFSHDYAEHMSSGMESESAAFFTHAASNVALKFLELPYDEKMALLNQLKASTGTYHPHGEPN